MQRIDAHCHIIVEQITRLHGSEAWRPRLERAAEGIYAATDRVRNGPMPRECTDVGRMIDEMDSLRVDRMLVCPPPFLFFYELPKEEGIRACRIQNDALAALQQRHPRRFSPLATVPLQDVNSAMQELKRATWELGLCGVEIGSNVRGVHLGDPCFRPFWSACAREDLFVFIHPDYFQAHSSPTLGEYYLVNLAGNPSETGLAAAHMIFSGLLEEFSGLKVLLAHAGGTLPWIVGRCSRGHRKRPESRQHLRTDPLESARKFYFDTITHSQTALAYLVGQFGADHVLLGSDYPFDMGLDDPVAQVESLGSLSESESCAILGGTVARLLKLA